MPFNYNKLRGRIIEKFGTIEKFSVSLGVTFETVSKKLNNKVSFSQKDIISWSDKLDIISDDIGSYFFAL